MLASLDIPFQSAFIMVRHLTSLMENGGSEVSSVVSFPDTLFTAALHHTCMMMCKSIITVLHYLC